MGKKIKKVIEEQSIANKERQEYLMDEQEQQETIDLEQIMAEVEEIQYQENQTKQPEIQDSNGVPKERQSNTFEISKKLIGQC